MYGKIFLCYNLAIAQYLDLFEDNLEKWISGCFHLHKDEERCGCWDCEDCGKIKTCVSCSLGGNSV